MLYAASQEQILGGIDMSGRIITIAQQKGGSGKTTLAVNLATGFLAKGKSVGILDTDPQGSLGKWFMKRIETQGEDPNLQFSTATAWGISYELRSLSDKVDVVIVDTPPKADSDLRPALRAADLVLVPLSSSHVDIWATQDVLDLADRAGKRAFIVMNRCRSGTKLGAEVLTAVHELDAEVMQTGLGNRIVFAEALGNGMGAVEARKKSPATTEVFELVNEVESTF
ncbi:MAG: ParA family partition ATPase [Paracoccaceae bacterium]